ncbi:protoheme IX farnesyltransferase [Picrophilus oshimae DSM 9789]|nr:protoheme IX farnesyltransferase [Picrophilus oshimae DSM 9789]
MYMNKLRAYFIYSKPQVWWLLVFIGLIGSILAINSFKSYLIILLLVALVANMTGSMGAEGLTNYIDRDMDSIMERTRNRPLPSGEISEKGAFLFGIILSLFSIFILLIFKRYLAALFMFLGLFDNVFIYSYLLKRRTPYSIILGGFSGAFPVLIGWYTVTDRFSWIPFILFFLVMFWIPVHVWSLAYKYRDDYYRAGVPMLPVVYSDRKTAVSISLSSMLLILFSVIPYFLGFFNYLYLLVILILSVPIVIYSVNFIKKPTKKASMRLFIYTAPYLTFVFFIVMIIHIIEIIK